MLLNSSGKDLYKNHTNEPLALQLKQLNSCRCCPISSGG
nr:MAG TPA: hypothetical protein [Caudoviricetes sp.]